MVRIPPFHFSKRILDRWRSVFDSRRLQKSSVDCLDYLFFFWGVSFFHGGFFGVSFCICYWFFTVKGLMDGWVDGWMGKVREVTEEAG